MSLGHVVSHGSKPDKNPSQQAKMASANLYVVAPISYVVTANRQNVVALVQSLHRGSHPPHYGDVETTFPKPLNPSSTKPLTHLFQNASRAPKGP